MDKSRRKKEIKVLLQDYMNFLPSGPQEAFVPIGAGTDCEDGWPLTEECERRMDKNSPIGKTYKYLDAALVLLNRQYPELYNILLGLYLHPEAGHSDVDVIMQRSYGREKSIELLEKHEKALEQLAEYTRNVDLYVRTSEKPTGPRDTLEDEHDEVYSLYDHLMSQGGAKKSDSVKEVAFHSNYSISQVYRILKEREETKVQ